MEITDFYSLFSCVVVGYYNSGYINNVYSNVGDNGTQKWYTFTTKNTDHIYIGMSYYSQRMYPTGCHETIYSSVSLYTYSGLVIASTQLYDLYTFPFLEY